jgi:hypothetical protein
MGLQPVPLPDASHRRGTDPNRLGHRRRGPMVRLMRRRLISQGNDAIDGSRPAKAGCTRVGSCRG